MWNACSTLALTFARFGKAWDAHRRGFSYMRFG